MPDDSRIGAPDRGWLARLGPLLATHRMRLSLALLAAVGSMAIGVSIPLVLRSAIDTAVDDNAADIDALEQLFYLSSTLESCPQSIPSSLLGNAKGNVDFT